MRMTSMTNLGDLTQIMEIEVKRNKEAGTIEQDQAKYTRFSMSDCNPVHTPGIEKELRSQPDGTVPLDGRANYKGL